MAPFNRKCRKNRTSAVLLVHNFVEPHPNVYDDKSSFCVPIRQTSHALAWRDATAVRRQVKYPTNPGGTWDMWRRLASDANVLNLAAIQSWSSWPHRAESQGSGNPVWIGGLGAFEPWLLRDGQTPQIQTTKPSNPNHQIEKRFFGMRQDRGTDGNGSFPLRPPRKKKGASVNMTGFFLGCLLTRDRKKPEKQKEKKEEKTTHPRNRMLLRAPEQRHASLTWWSQDYVHQENPSDWLSRESTAKSGAIMLVLFLGLIKVRDWLVVSF